jgi:hypothetical protein
MAIMLAINNTRMPIAMAIILSPYVTKAISS